MYGCIHESIHVIMAFNSVEMAQDRFATAVEIIAEPVKAAGYYRICIGIYCST